MGPGRTIADLERQAKRVGATLVDARFDRAGVLIGQFDVPDYEDGVPWNTALLLENLASEDDSVGAVPEELVTYAHENGPAALQAFVQNAIRFQDEETETFMSPAVALSLGAADCDDSERALVAVARAAGWKARLVYYMQDGRPAHVSAQIDSGDGQGWCWAETTIAAHYGEDPLVALARLKIPRSDIDGTAYILVDGAAVPLASASAMGKLRRSPGRRSRVTTMGQMGQATWPSYLGATFAQTLVNYSALLGANPLDILKLLLSEAGLQPNAQNTRGFPAGSTGAVGINQLAPTNYGYISNAGYSVSQYLQLTAEEQIPVAFAYFTAVMQNAGLSSISGRDLYWLNFLPATYVAGADDDYVICGAAGPLAWAYSANTGLDHGGKGTITAGDLQKSLDAAAHGSLWNLVSLAITEDDPLTGAPTPLAGLVIFLAFAAGSYLADASFVRSLARHLV